VHGARGGKEQKMSKRPIWLRAIYLIASAVLVLSGMYPVAYQAALTVA
jgi:hypothetical protein